MIELLFEFAGDFVLVVIRGNDIKFGLASMGNQLTDISGLNLNYKGVIKEFPDLENKKNWRQETIRRFKELIKSYNTEKGKAKYIIDDLKRYGYKPMYQQIQGFRRTKINE